MILYWTKLSDLASQLCKCRTIPIVLTFIVFQMHVPTASQGHNSEVRVDTTRAVTGTSETIDLPAALLSRWPENSVLAAEALVWRMHD
jgi:hypothetical protein